MKKMLAFMLSAVLLIGLFAGCGQEPAETAAPTTTAPATTEAPKGLAKLCQDVKQFMEAQGYPKCFGGCYLDTEAYTVVILATDVKEAKSLLKDLLKDWDKDDYRFADASAAYQKLLEAEQKVYDSMEIWTAMDVQIASVTIDDMNSCVSVGVVDLNSGNMKAVKEMVNDPLVKFYNVPSDSLD